MVNYAVGIVEHSECRVGRGDVPFECWFKDTILLMTRVWGREHFIVGNYHALGDVI